jgi:hypothetical protein
MGNDVLVVLKKMAWKMDISKLDHENVMLIISIKKYLNK